MIYINFVGRARNPEAKTTKREMYWSDVDIISTYKKPVKRWNNQKNIQYEADKDVLHRMIVEFQKNNKPENLEPVSTYCLQPKVVSDSVV